ncbi:MAG: hypothetical protein B6229_09970 [Spirochaetaceae bacterium 4572_7]|nr:MAG: hypothetical protein B6229_09970 [Spirochaetaceae bacterium 4572_7]
MNIEIKGRGSSRKVADILKNEITNKGRSVDDFQISSFDHIELVSFHQLYPSIRISPLITCNPVTLAAFAEDMGAWSLNVHREFISQEIVEDAHKRGMKVFVYTVNYPEQLAKLEKLNVDGVFTNNRFRLLGL